MIFGNPIMLGGGSTTEIGVVLYGAPLEVISVYDSEYPDTLLKSVVTDENGYSPIFLRAGIYKFVGSVSEYEKVVAINDTTSILKVMPDGALYWYGYINGAITDYTASDYQSVVYGAPDPKQYLVTVEKNTNNLKYVDDSTTGYAVGGFMFSGYSLNISDYIGKKLYMNASFSKISGGLAADTCVGCAIKKQNGWYLKEQNAKVKTDNLDGTNKTYSSDIVGDGQPVVFFSVGGSPAWTEYGIINAIWLE